MPSLRQLLRRHFGRSIEREFEKKAHPVLEIFDPAIRLPPRRGLIDRAGIDLYVDATTKNHPNFMQWVVQCKGFEEFGQALDASSLRQIQDSIDTFRESKYSCDKYTLLHGRIANDPKIRDRVDKLLLGLVADRKAKYAERWSIDDLAKAASAQVRSHLGTALSLQTRSFVASASDSPDDLTIELTGVECQRGELEIASNGIDKYIAWSSDVEQIDATTLLNEAENQMWVLLVGNFGMGKSTLAMRAALARDSNVLFVSMRSVLGADVGASSNGLLAQITANIEILPEMSRYAQSLWSQWIVPELSALVESQDRTLTVILDGIDESPRYRTRQGLGRLFHELESLRAPLILSTRDEHFAAFESDMNRQLGKMSGKRGNNRPGKLLRLRAWSHQQAIELLDQYESKSPELTEQENWLLFRKALREPESIDTVYFGSPLFLQLAVSLAAAGRWRFYDHPAQIIYEWTRFKIRRDLETGEREAVFVGGDTEQQIGRLIKLMGGVALKLISESDEGVYFDEYLSSDEVIVEAERHSAIAPKIEVITTTTLLMVETTGRRTQRCRFFHGAFRDFFAAFGNASLLADARVQLPSECDTYFDWCEDFIISGGSTG